jgi:hypothetical protein
MRRIAILFVLLGSLFAEENPKARARELEIEAQKALEEGRRADALRLLREAGDQRAGKTAAPPRERAAAALAEMQAALAKGDAAAALAAGQRAHGALSAWSKELEPSVEERLDRLARQIEELQRRQGR